MPEKALTVSLQSLTKLFKPSKDIQRAKNWHGIGNVVIPKTVLELCLLLKNIPHVHVVILYKNQLNITVSAVDHVLKQVGVNVKITAIDNNSTDSTIAKKLQEMGVEVIRVEEPFNYSRLNNIAVHQTKIGANCENILFLNNDVDLDSNALLEMCRWIEQPGIGLVGCRLNYPNGLLQHGGVIIETSRAAFIKSWHHVWKKAKNSTDWRKRISCASLRQLQQLVA